MLSKKLIFKQAQKMQTIRGIDPFTIRPQDLDKVTQIISDQCKFFIQQRVVKEFEYCWMSRKTMKKKHIVNKFSPIGKMEKVVNGIVTQLQDNFPMEIRHTINKGPEYTYYTSKKYRYNSDWVCVPEPDRFTESKYYYKTLLHELSHAACSRTRLCLKFNEEHEEVAVETCALIVCFLSGYNLWESCLGYMINWSYDKSGNLSIGSKSQWDSIKKKTQRIVRYLIYGTDRL